MVTIIPRAGVRIEFGLGLRRSGGDLSVAEGACALLIAPLPWIPIERGISAVTPFADAAGVEGKSMVSFRSGAISFPPLSVVAGRLRRIWGGCLTPGPTGVPGLVIVLRSISRSVPRSISRSLATPD